MHPYQIMGIILCCTLFFSGVVALLTMQGVNILLVLIGVYLALLVCMVMMQRRARESFELLEARRRLRANQQSRKDVAPANEYPANKRSKKPAFGVIS